MTALTLRDIQLMLLLLYWRAFLLRGLFRVYFLQFLRLRVGLRNLRLFFGGDFRFLFVVDLDPIRWFIVIGSACSTFVFCFWLNILLNLNWCRFLLHWLFLYILRILFLLVSSMRLSVSPIFGISFFHLQDFTLSLISLTLVALVRNICLFLCCRSQNILTFSLIFVVLLRI